MYLEVNKLTAGSPGNTSSLPGFFGSSLSGATLSGAAASLRSTETIFEKSKTRQRHSRLRHFINPDHHGASGNSPARARSNTDLSVDVVPPAETGRLSSANSQSLSNLASSPLTAVVAPQPRVSTPTIRSPPDGNCFQPLPVVTDVFGNIGQVFESTRIFWGVCFVPCLRHLREWDVGQCIRAMKHFFLQVTLPLAEDNNSML